MILASRYLCPDVSCPLECGQDLQLASNPKNTAKVMEVISVITLHRR